MDVVAALRGTHVRGILPALLGACLIAAPPAAAGVVGPKHSGELSANLARLAEPAVRSQPPARQAALLGIPASGPGSLVREGRRVLVNVRFQGGAIAALPELRADGARVVSASHRFQTATVAATPATLHELTAVSGVASIWEVPAPVLYGSPSASAFDAASCEGGSVISEGLTQLRVGEARESFGLRGKGVTVGVLSDSFDVAENAADGSGPVATHAGEDVLSAELPGPAGSCSGQQAAVHVLQEGPSNGEDEGRAMLQIVHDLAPHASLAFATAFESEEGFAQNVERLARPVSAGGAGAKVIVDDVAWLEEPFYQDGPIATAINRVSADGVTYLSAAGNNNLFEGEHETASWEAPEFRDTGACPAPVVQLSEEIEEESGPSQGLNPSHCMDFDPGAGEDDTFRITVDPGAVLTVDLQWAEPWNGVNTDLDAYLDAGGEVVAGSAAINTGKAGTQRPVELLQWQNESAEAKAEVELAINRYTGASPRLKFAMLENGGGVSATEYPESGGGDVVGPTIFGHAGAAATIAVGAVHFGDATKPEAYSSRGPVTHLFGAVEGPVPAAALGSPEPISKPDLVATDCGATSFFAQPSGSVWRFCGTSAAAPHAAAVAALLRQGDPAATPEEVRGALTGGAVPIAGFGPDAVGAGLLDAVGALEAHPPSVEIDDGPSTVVAPLVGGPEPPPSTGPTEPEAAPSPAPTTSILRHPRRVVRTRHRTVRVGFRFGSDQRGVVFLCRVDSGRLHRCGTRFVHRFAVGRHVIRVIARGRTGGRDRTPAVFRLRVIRVG